MPLNTPPPYAVPPAQYDHAPTVPVLAYILSQAEIDRYCAAAAVLPGGRHGGCARVLAKPQPPASYYIAKMGSAPVYWAPTPGSRAWSGLLTTSKASCSRSCGATSLRTAMAGVSAPSSSSVEGGHPRAQAQCRCCPSVGHGDYDPRAATCWP